jgi:limonene 1,2-monooxygenase
MTIDLRHGMFSAPYHNIEENPTLLLRHEIDLAEHLDGLGYDEAWFGEHHSGGFEMVSSPELIIAAAAERTRRIKLGTGVVSLTYHNPLNVANRIIQLDHMTQGRVLFGVGPGVLVTDAIMNGIDPVVQRNRMVEALDVIIRLLRGETVTEKSEWYTLEQARTHLLPYTKPYPEMAVASVLTPSGARAAGKYGLGLLAVAATSPQGFETLPTNWRIANEIAAENGNEMRSEDLRVVIPMHIAATREQARKDVEFGLEKWFQYYGMVSAISLGELEGRSVYDYLMESKRIVIGTPDDAIEAIERLHAQVPFGTVLHLAHDWADWEARKKSYELYARFVIPHFSGANAHRVETNKWMIDNLTQFDAKRQEAYQQMFSQHAAERAKAGQ